MNMPSMTSALPTHANQVEGCRRKEPMRGNTGTRFFFGRIRGRIKMLASSKHPAIMYPAELH